VVATSIQQTIDDFAAQSNAFQYLFEAFMSLGLIVGIAALGVIAFRTVAERRQQIGMLRAIGYSRRLVAISFFLESSFIAVTGIGMGLILGGALSYNLLTSPSSSVNGAEIDFSMPWVRSAGHRWGRLHSERADDADPGPERLARRRWRKRCATPRRRTTPRTNEKGRSSEPPLCCS
jgi:hypothetical protein